MRRCWTTLLALITFAVAGCSVGGRVTDTSELNCAQIADPVQIPSEAIAAGIDFVTALHTYDIKRIRELAVPNLREVMVKEAFNGPNAAPIQMLEPPRVTDTSLCGRAVKLTIRTRVQYSGGTTGQHTIYLTVRQQRNNWLIADMAADYSS